MEMSQNVRRFILPFALFPSVALFSLIDTLPDAIEAASPSSQSKQSDYSTPDHEDVAEIRILTTLPFRRHWRHICTMAAQIISAADDYSGKPIDCPILYYK